MHFHWGKGNQGSEHRINGKQAALEIHLIHFKSLYGTFGNALTKSDGLLVIATLFEVILLIFF